MSAQGGKEGFPPVPNAPPGDTVVGKALFHFRSLLDLQVSSVRRHLRPWLQERSGTLLEVGCGAQAYRYLVPTNCHYTGLDWEEAGANFNYRHPDTVYYQGDTFPLKTAPLITCSTPKFWSISTMLGSFLLNATG